MIGFVARLDPWKGLDVFLRAAKHVSERVPQAHFLIVGDAPFNASVLSDVARGVIAPPAGTETTSFTVRKESL